jgi:hypothetical protein
MSGPHSPTGGVQAFPIGGRLVRERERLAGMTAEERAFRKQYLKDQELSKNEPRFVPEYWKERTNPIRRFYQFPLNTVENIIKPVIVSSFCFGESADDVTITNVLGTESGPANPLLDRQVLDGWLRSPRWLLLLQIQRQRKSPSIHLDQINSFGNFGLSRIGQEPRAGESSTRESSACQEMRAIQSSATDRAHLTMLLAASKLARFKKFAVNQTLET